MVASDTFHLLIFLFAIFAYRDRTNSMSRDVTQYVSLHPNLTMARDVGLEQRAEASSAP